jgi:arylsulfatase A-like enzyme
MKHVIKAVWVLWFLLPVPADASEKPNLLFVMTDDQRWDTVAALGNSEIQTPVQDSLVKRGFVFKNCYCMGSMVPAVCAPSRTMVMTGKSLWHIPEPRARSYAGPTLGKSFRDAGYATFFCGKKGNTFLAGNADFETAVYDLTKPDDLSARKHCAQFLADHAIDWLNQQKRDQPWCMYLGPPVPHDPRVAPDEFTDLYDPQKLSLSPNFLPEHPFDNGELRVRDELLAPFPRTRDIMKQHLADYYASITCFDHHLGRILNEIDRRAETPNTLIVFTSDHGLAVGGQHGLMGKQNLYESNKPPLIIAGPGIPAGQQSDALVFLFDLYPTVCEASGIPLPSAIDGISLMPIIRGRSTRVRETLLGAYRDCQRMIRDSRWKLIYYRTGSERHTQLFDLQSDPDEVTNLADNPQYAAERQRLEHRLAQELKTAGDPIDFNVVSSAAPK